MMEISGFRGTRLPALKPKARNIEGIGTRLKRVRTDLHMKQEAVAAHLGVGTRTYVEREAGRRAMSIGEIAALSDLGISTDWLLTGHGAMLRTGIAQSELSESRGETFGGGESSSGELRDGQEDALHHRPRLTVEEIGLVLRRTRASVDQAIEMGGWRPPRMTEEALMTMLFTLALRGADATVADIVEFLGFVRQDLERNHKPS